MLEKMNEKTKNDEFDAGLYSSEIERFKALRRDTLQTVDAGYQDDATLGDPFDAWFPRIYDNVQTTYPDVGFKAQDWQSARKLADRNLEAPATDTLLPVILNAAWYCRARQPDRIREFEGRGTELSRQARSGDGAGGPTTTQR
jgi:hypothetical protein